MVNSTVHYILKKYIVGKGLVAEKDFQIPWNYQGAVQFTRKLTWAKICAALSCHYGFSIE